MFGFQTPPGPTPHGQCRVQGSCQVLFWLYYVSGPQRITWSLQEVTVFAGQFLSCAWSFAVFLPHLSLVHSRLRRAEPVFWSGGILEWRKKKSLPVSCSFTQIFPKLITIGLEESL